MDTVSGRSVFKKKKLAPRCCPKDLTQKCAEDLAVERANCNRIFAPSSSMILYYNKLWFMSRFLLLILFHLFCTKQTLVLHTRKQRHSVLIVLTTMHICFRHNTECQFGYFLSLLLIHMLSMGNIFCYFRLPFSNPSARLF